MIQYLHDISDLYPFYTWLHQRRGMNNSAVFLFFFWKDLFILYFIFHRFIYTYRYIYYFICFRTTIARCLRYKFGVGAMQYCILNIIAVVPYIFPGVLCLYFQLIVCSFLFDCIVTDYCLTLILYPCFNIIMIEICLMAKRKLKT